VLSRHVPVPGSPKHHDGATYFEGDVTTGVGLDAALAGADVVIDCLEGQFGKARKEFAGGGARLAQAARDAGAGRAVLLSIVNCDRSTYPYYVSKAAKERVYEDSGLTGVVVRATQFHSLAAMAFAAGSMLGLIPVFKGVRFQTISPADAARAVLEAAVGPACKAGQQVLTVGGPEVLSMADMAVSWKAVTGARGALINVPLPGAMGRYLRAGLNVVADQKYGRETFVSWLENSRKTL
jgi:uncharacterized protein YbjT (DUF2867 family)